MAVYEKHYTRYTGDLTRKRSRFLVLPRYAYRDVFASKFFLAYFVACFLVPLGLALLIYMPHNVKFLETVAPQLKGMDLVDFWPMDASWGEFFLDSFLRVQAAFGFFLALVIGPALVSRDMTNNGLPLYLSRPFSRTEYVIGKMSVLAILLSAITWIPGLLLFALQSYLAGWSWFTDNLRIAVALLLGSWMWILVLCLMSLALSAWLKWKPVARASMFVIFWIAAAGAGMINFVFETAWGSLLNISTMMAVVLDGLFGVPDRTDFPTWAAWLSLIAFCGFCVFLLARRIRAYEVVRS